MDRALRRGIPICLLAIVCIGPARLAADEIGDDLRIIAQVGPNAAHAAAARQARDRLARHGIEILPRLLDALDTPDVLAANWYRTIFDELVARESKRPQPQFPVAFLKEYVSNPARQGRTRRLVLDLLERLEPEYPTALIPTLLEDREFRNDAVAAVLRQGEAAQKAQQTEAARAAFRKAFEHARDAEQIRLAAGKLAGIGEKVNIVEKMGFLTDWYLLGPFDAPEYSGYKTVFPPEQKVDLSARYLGQEDREIGWKRFATPDAFGQLNLIDAVASTREAVGYAYTEVLSPRNQEVQLRCGADDNCTVWVNGRRVFGREQWLNGTRLDRFTAPVTLVAGKNTVLVKICQGPQHKDPEVPNNWSLQIRFCDAEGAAVGLKSALPPAPTASGN